MPATEALLQETLDEFQLRKLVHTTAEQSIATTSRRCESSTTTTW